MQHDAVRMLPEPERRSWLLAALADLLRRADWRHFVGTPIVLPRPEHFPERWPPDLRGVRLPRDLPAEPEDDEPDDLPAADESAVRMVFRVWRRPWSDRTPLVFAIAVASLVAVALLPRDPIGLTLVATLAALAVVATGHRRSPVCSDPACRTAIPRAAAVCPGCGGAVAGDLDSADQRLAAEEAVRGQPHAHRRLLPRDDTSA